jgi:hypothetical protein
MVKVDKDYNGSFRHFMSNFVHKEAGRFLAHGAFGEVFAKKKDATKVLKVGLFDYKNKSSDAYLNFVEEISSHQHNPLFPKIHGIQFFHGIHKRKKTSWYVIEMERLTPLDKKYVVRHEKRGSLASILWRCMSQIDEDAKSIHGMIANIKKQVNKAKATDRQKQLAKEALDVIKTLIVENKPDLHLENFMRRGRQLVITDPVSYARSHCP